MRQFWSNNKTKIMGGLVLIVQYLQLPGNSGVIEKHIGTSGLEILGILFGITIIIIGVVNGGPPPSSSAARTPWFVSIIGFLLVIAMLSGCAGTKFAYKQANSLDEYAYVATEQYAAAVKEAADYKESAGSNASMVAKLQAADAKARPLFDEVRPLAESYRNVKDAKTAAELQAALDKAIPALAELLRSLKATGSPQAYRLEATFEQFLKEARWTPLRYRLSLSAS